MNAGEPDNSLFDYRTPWMPTLFARFENFGDANAQYNLARMHFEGAGVKKDSRWLFLAADKGHLQAQALLGQTLFSGREGVRPQRALGLMWLTLARKAAIDSKKDNGSSISMRRRWLRRMAKTGRMRSPISKII
jgi:TPR repeat protein